MMMTTRTERICSTMRCTSTAIFWIAFQDLADLLATTGQTLRSIPTPRATLMIARTLLDSRPIKDVKLKRLCVGEMLDVLLVAHEGEITCPLSLPRMMWRMFLEMGF